MSTKWKAVLAVTLFACGDNIPGEPRITGRVFSDDNNNGTQDDGEAGIAGLTVFVDFDGNNTLTEADLTAETDADGRYTIVVPGPAMFGVRTVLPFGFRAREMQAKPRIAPIIGGTDATANQYGFMVSVGSKFGGGVFPFCGGVLISDRHVVTAAHCSQGEDARDVGVIAGTLDPFDGGETFDVEDIQIHPDFDGDPSNGFDISLWTLKEPIDLTALNLNTVEMLTPDNAALAAPGKLSTTLGWGVSDSSSPLLQQVHLPLVSESVCADQYPSAQAFETQICAGAPEGGIDSCQGDSGGPLLVRDDERGVWMHAGITSYGDGCALPDVPGVYGRVSALSSWALVEAQEAPGFAAVTIVSDGEIATADFPTRRTTRPQVGAIDARWQLTGTTIPDTVGANTPVNVHWAIVGDGTALTGFTCKFDPDLSDAVAAQDVACALGATDLTFPGFATGIFAASVTVTRDDIAFERRVEVFSGSPTSTTTNGSLDNADPLDPDYNDPFHVDYFDITGLSGKAFAIEAESSAFGMFLTLYDLAERDFANGGGILEFGTQISNDGQRIVVVPEAGTNYVIGVSTQGVNETGSYTIKILNDGTLTPH